MLNLGIQVENIYPFIWAIEMAMSRYYLCIIHQIKVLRYSFQWVSLEFS